MYQRMWMRSRSRLVFSSTQGKERFGRRHGEERGQGRLGEVDRGRRRWISLSLMLSYVHPLLIPSTYLPCQLANLTSMLPTLLYSSLARTESLLSTAQSVSLFRHELLDLISLLQSQLSSPTTSLSSSKKSSLLSTGKELLERLEEAMVGDNYLGVVERLLVLR
jgi:hypothetical protein